jgi:hypothetical protein
MQRDGAAVALFAMSAALLLSGCAKQKVRSGPKTVPVRGKVMFTKGGDVKALFNKQARIEFESIEQPGVRAAGAIEEDGSFVVATITPEGGSIGAVPGTHRVRLDLEENAQKLVAPQFLDFMKSGLKVTVPSEAPIEIKVWR